MEREIKATPEEALAFLTKYAGAIAVGLELARKASESRLVELTVNGPEKYGPDDLDRLIKLSRENITTRDEAATELRKLAPVKDTPQLRELGQFISRLREDAPPEDK